MMPNKKKKIKVRHPREADIPYLLKVEFERYDLMYELHPEKKQEVEQVFRKRISIAKNWMWVLIVDGEPSGFITGQPTNKSPKDFESWEKSTDNGTLETTFEPKGRNVYVVNLDVSRSATPIGGQYMLMAALGGEIIKTSKDTIMFESRMPSFREWVINELDGGLDKWGSLPNDKKQDVAEEYAGSMTERKGKMVRFDRLLRFYEGSGFNLVKVIPNAFSDEESLDFGMLCTGKNPIPRWLRLMPINWLVGSLLEKVGRSPDLLSKFVG